MKWATEPPGSGSVALQSDGHSIRSKAAHRAAGMPTSNPTVYPAKPFHGPIRRKDANFRLVLTGKSLRFDTGTVKGRQDGRRP